MNIEDVAEWIKKESDVNFCINAVKKISIFDPINNLRNITGNGNNSD